MTPAADNPHHPLPTAFDFPSLDEARVAELARQLAARIRGGEVFLLEGPLGAGKTFFTRALAAALDVASGVSSPTYVILCSHPAARGLTLHHLDFYRFTRPEAADELGLDDLRDDHSVVVVEWPDRCPQAVDDFTLRLRFGLTDETHRRVSGTWGGLRFDRSALDV
jgi:tRNA threonylcarbamoyl adenosine modification protein YjeE